MSVRGRYIVIIITLVLLSWYLVYPRVSPPLPPQPRSPGALGLITEPEDGIAPVLGLIQGARSSLELVMYQFQDQAVASALVEAQGRGVKVRVLLNHGYRGQADPTNEPVYSYLLNHGVVVKWSPGLYDLTHEKSLEVDNRLILIMTFNLTPQYYASGREFGIIDRDPHDVEAASSVFEADWHSRSIRAPAADGLVWSPGSRQAILELINGAHQSLDVYNEEMADDQITVALEAAVSRGVTVRVCMTYATAWKSAFGELSQAGVQVRTYTTTASLYIHAKMVLADGKRAFVGSENFSAPSLEANRELGLVLSDPTIIKSIIQTFERDFSSAQPYLVNQ
jgi:phosphatidylserine/phosphatidylglycerophosphate/cardiolipin synthase-like enzyme